MLTEEEYWRIYKLIYGDVEAAIKSNQTYLTIENLAKENPDVLTRINKDADFWTLNAYALQTTFFIAFARLFDPRRDVYSIYKLLDMTAANPGFFSKTALRARKMSTMARPAPPWVEDFINSAWEPGVNDLLSLKSDLNPHSETFKKIYQPIRHSFFAHRGMETDDQIFAKFQKTSTAQVDVLLRFLFTLLRAIWEMAWNGKRPDLTDSQDYERAVMSVNKATENLIRKLP